MVRKSFNLLHYVIETLVMMEFSYFPTLPFFKMVDKLE